MPFILVELPVAGTSSKYINLLPTPSGLGVYLQYDESIYELTCDSTSSSTTEIPETTTSEYYETTTDNEYDTTTASSTCIWKKLQLKLQAESYQSAMMYLPEGALPEGYSCNP